MIEFFHECVPMTITAQQRKHRYKGAVLKRAEAFWQAIFELHVPEKPVKGALILVINMTYPHTDVSAKANNGLPVPKLTVPDCDNINKLPQDAMAKLKYFTNDARIYNQNVIKWFGEMPGVHVKLYADPDWNKVYEKIRKGLKE